MVLTAAHFSPIIALIAGILILIMPRLLNYVVAFYLIAMGLIGLNGIYNFIHSHPRHLFSQFQARHPSYQNNKSVGDRG